MDASELALFLIECVVPENILTPPMEGIQDSGGDGGKRKNKITEIV